MRHLGDITKLHGWEIPPVDLITGGSPCQDLSLAGKRAGLAGERSGLFMDQIRIVKEMRDATRTTALHGRGIKPRYMCWENVAGAFSSNSGRDFQAVLSEIIRVADPEVPDVPMPEKTWPHSGCIYDEMGKWSVAWRLHDAQHWGVPQRRKRIALVADFGGLSAAEVLFERKGMSWYPAESGEQGESAAGDPASGIGKAIGIDVYNQSITGETAATLSAACGGTTSSGAKVLSFQERAGKPGGGKGILIQEDSVCSIRTRQNQSMLAFEPGIASREGGHVYEDISPTVRARDYKDPNVVYGIGRPAYNQGYKAQFSFQVEKEMAPTQVAQGPGAVATHTVRRLTPLECERLQGFPDGWTDIGRWTDSKGKVHESSDSARYKALGNSIAVGYANNQSGFWMNLMKRISAQYERSATLGSLFDGIGGFPLAWEFYNGKGSAVWASEIEEFPIAVTKKRFGE